jgi:CubicO group peptidase (beta-lactamase class C family)
MSAAHVEGLGVALIRDGQVVYRHSFCIRDKAGDPLTPNTVMYGASLTKATFAWTVMQLVDEGRVDLDRPIVAYVPKLLPDYPAYQSLAGDDRWRRLTMRILLDHTTPRSLSSCLAARFSLMDFLTMSSISAAGTREIDPADAVFASPCRKGADT